MERDIIGAVIFRDKEYDFDEDSIISSNVIVVLVCKVTMGLF